MIVTGCKVHANKISEKAEIDFVNFPANFNIRLAIIQQTKILWVTQKCEINFGALSKILFFNISLISLHIIIALPTIDALLRS